MSSLVLIWKRGNFIFINKIAENLIFSPHLEKFPTVDSPQIFILPLAPLDNSF